MVRPPNFKPIPTGAISSCSTNTSMEITAPGLVRVTRLVGPGAWHVPSRLQPHTRYWTPWRKATSWFLSKRYRRYRVLHRWAPCPRCDGINTYHHQRNTLSGPDGHGKPTAHIAEPLAP